MCQSVAFFGLYSRSHGACLLHLKKLQLDVDHVPLVPDEESLAGNTSNSQNILQRMSRTMLAENCDGDDEVMHVEQDYNHIVVDDDDQHS